MYYNENKQLRSTSQGLNINIPWDSNTAKGFIAALLILILFFFISPFIQIDNKPFVKEIKTSIPIELLILGSGDGTGRKSGNLTAEGALSKGQNPTINIEDAQKTSNDVNNKKSTTSNTDIATDFKPVDKMSGDKNPSKVTGTDPKNVGDNNNGDNFGTGLGSKGSGKGAGDGFGDIDWGGGGNRVVLEKPLPKFPNGVRTSGQIILRFKVLPDGTVTSVVPLQKADPELEFAAVQALKKWRFNALKEDSPIMVGQIPLTFILR